MIDGCCGISGPRGLFKHLLCLSICLPVLSICLSIYLSACLSICLSACLSICYLHIYLSAYLSSICMYKINADAITLLPQKLADLLNQHFLFYLVFFIEMLCPVNYREREKTCSCHFLETTHSLKFMRFFPPVHLMASDSIDCCRWKQCQHSYTQIDYCHIGRSEGLLQQY